MVLPESFHAVLIEGMDPALDRARILAEPPRYLVTAAALGDQQHAAKPQEESLLARRPDRGVDQLSDPFRTAEAELAHGVAPLLLALITSRCKPRSCGNGSVA
jgi:hypothetical protein